MNMKLPRRWSFAPESGGDHESTGQSPYAVSKRDRWNAKVGRKQLRAGCVWRPRGGESSVCLFAIVSLIASFALGQPPAGSPVAKPNSTTKLGSNSAVKLPDIKHFAKHRSGRFIVDFQHVRTGHPYLGANAVRPHTGGHVYFQIPREPIPPQRVESFPAIYAVADGYVSRIDEYFKLRPVFHRRLGKEIANRRYGVTLAIARKDGATVDFHYSIEPMTDPGDPDFYKPFILVQRGQPVKAGDVIARMYLPPQRDIAEKTHIHFNLMDTGRRKFMAPTIFSDMINRRFHATWGERGVDGEQRIPACMGFRLSPTENPFGTGAQDKL